MRWAPRGVAAALVALCLGTAAGCGSSDTSSTGTGTGTGAAPATSAESGGADTKLAADYKGTFSAFPTSAPKPQAGTSVWVISLNEASPGVHSATQGIVDAAKQLGWQTRVVDTKGAPDGGAGRRHHRDQAGHRRQGRRHRAQRH
jgi:hypothetical protein